MHKRGQSDFQDFQPLPALYEPPSSQRSVFPGKPHLQQNLSMQRSIMEIFDEFTEIVSGELKSLNMKEFEQERKRPSQ
jgi:hypothetical protein